MLNTDEAALRDHAEQNVRVRLRYTSRRKEPTLRNASIIFLLSAITLLMAQSRSYKVTHTYTLGGDGSWDYVVPDPPNHRVFIARQNRVMVVNEDNGMLLGEITGIQGAHGTAIAQGTGHG